MSATFRRLAARTGRITRIARRFRLDGRLPEPTARLVKDLARLELRTARQACTSQVRMWVRWPTSTGELRRAAGYARPWLVSGQLDTSVDEVAHGLAGEVVQQLRSAGLAPFLVDDDDRHLHIGLPADDRSRALAALEDLGADTPWYIRSRRGHRHRLARLRPGRAWSRVFEQQRRRGARRAEAWWVFRCLAAGPELVVGPEQAVEISFWAPGTSGRNERLGHRGLQRYEADAASTTERIGEHLFPGSSAFPVSRSPARMREPIDVVYTWVDGDDPAWRAEFEHWRSIDRPEQRGDHAAHDSRYASRDELRYSLRSLWANAGWVRHVYVVTAGQVPEWLRGDERLTIVPHHSIFPAEWLPTFNSHSIESRLHHIDGLAEHFVYFNDDMFLGRPLASTRFFTPNGLSRYFESEARVPVNSAGGPDLAVDTAARRGQQIIENEFGVTITHKLHHAPYALRRSVMAEVEERFSDVVSATSRRRFRHPDDLSIPSAFAHHYAFCTGRAIPGELHVGYENLGSRRLGLFLRRAWLGRDFDAFCINETERRENDPARADALVAAFLERYFPVPSPWERSTPT